MRHATNKHHRENTHHVLPDDHGRRQDKPRCDRGSESDEPREPYLLTDIISGVLQCLEGDVVGRDGNQERQPATREMSESML